MRHLYPRRPDIVPIPPSPRPARIPKSQTTLPRLRRLCWADLLVSRPHVDLSARRLEGALLLLLLQLCLRRTPLCGSPFALRLQ
eukprot:4943340-Prymnesium_polylepis.1